MKVAHHPAADRGVSSLMYVGDDGLPSDTAIATRTRVQMVGLGVGLGYGIARTRGVLRLGLVGVALYLLSGRFPAA